MHYTLDQGRCLIQLKLNENKGKMTGINVGGNESVL
jgi:hypothetical protein